MAFHNEELTPINASEVPAWDDTADVIVVGNGGAGAAAALQAILCAAGRVAETADVEAPARAQA